MKTVELRLKEIHKAVMWALAEMQGKGEAHAIMVGSDGMPFVGGFKSKWIVVK